MKRFATGLAAWVLACAVWAQSPGDITVGTSLPLSGPNSAVGQEALTVMKAAFAQLNAQGGIDGRKLALEALDDGFNPQKAAENARAIAAGKAVAMFNCWGTASCSAVMPVITEAKLPLVAGIAGGGPMRAQPGRWAFNVRSTTEQELTRIVGHMDTVGQTRIALVYQNDPFGKSGQAAWTAVLARRNLKPAAELALEPDGSNVDAVVGALKQLANLSGVAVVAAPPPTVKLIPAARKAGLGIQFYNLAAQANRKVVADLGAYTSGVVFTTLVPSPWKDSIPVVHDYQKLVKEATGKSEFSYLGLEIYINTQVLIGGLRKAGGNVSRDSLVKALEGLPERRYGPMSLNYAEGHRDGSGYVGLTIIDREGRFIE